MTTYNARVKRAFSIQSTLLGRPEHCSADPVQLAMIGRALGDQIRIKRSDSAYALYTVSDVRPESPDYLIRMALTARERLGTIEEFDATVDAQACHPTYTDAEAKDHGEFVERLDDDGAHTGILFMAPHGGMIEQFTDAQAERAASQIAAHSVSTWRCKGWKQGHGAYKCWHITSTDISVASFPLLQQVIDRGFAYAVAFHGLELSRSLLNLAERDGRASYPQFTAVRGIPT